jgi:hypothetical protein
MGYLDSTNLGGKFFFGNHLKGSHVVPRQDLLEQMLIFPAKSIDD